MAGSHLRHSKDQNTDSVLSARVEAVRILADQIREPVTVVDQDCNVIYANHAAHEVGDRYVLDQTPAKCYAAFFHRSEPCTCCPAQGALETNGPQSVSCAPGWGPIASGVIQAFPLKSADGRATYVLEILKQNQDPSSSGPSSMVPQLHRHHDVLVPSTDTGLGDLIGRSAVMRDLFEMIRLVADSHATVLLQGESGTGKERVARTVHDLSYRREKPFVVVDCAALPESLLESELFGHMRGAFTGALSTKRGLFEEADGGTIFLDEIADTSAHFQSKLLRVLQEGEVKPVGSSRSIKVDVRIVSATNKNLLELVKAKAFREDLYYRLAVLPLVLPPLRDRREDIPLLARHFLAASCKRHRKAQPVLTPDAMAALTESPWPGNVRELE
ncbi:MAG: sigma-54-dependent Fis family transcriptional regulator, partial [Nitrospira sp.]|nr:sigma-54-dependent Fis family transcriptional regulator [Nitrospira sp.]